MEYTLSAGNRKMGLSIREIPGDREVALHGRAVAVDKDRIGSISFGVNPEGAPTGVGLDDWLYSGVVSIGIGRNIEEGGENETNFGWSLSLIDATVVIDGVTVVENGEIVV